MAASAHSPQAGLNPSGAARRTGPKGATLSPSKNPPPSSPHGAAAKSGFLSFLSGASPAERRTLLASALGWMLDGMDVTLYAMVIPDLLRDFHLTTAEAGLLASVTLIASAAGGILFGVLADRAGRRLALMGSIALYSLFTAACGLSRGLIELAAFRLLLGLGMGGEWATGAALVAETWRPEHRGKALGLMQSGYAVGYAMAALAAALILPRWGWRAVFFVGILPALLTLWIRHSVEESPEWLAGRAPTPTLARVVPGAATNHAGPENQDSPSPAALGSHTPAPRRGCTRALVVTLLMNSAALFAWWGLFTWIPSYLALPAARGGRGLTVASSSLWIFVMQAGMWLGYVSFGFAGDRISPKRAYVAYLLAAAALVPFYARARSSWTLLLLGPALAFFGTGHYTGFGIITAELFPTSFRASAMGFTYNFGRGLSAAAPWAIGALAAHWGFGSAFWMSAAAFLLAALIALAVPEPPAPRAIRGRGAASANFS